MMLSIPPVLPRISHISPRPLYVHKSAVDNYAAANEAQKITGYLPKDDGAKLAFKDADIIVIPAGIPRKYT